MLYAEWGCELNCSGFYNNTMGYNCTLVLQNRGLICSTQLCLPSRYNKGLEAKLVQEYRQLSTEKYSQVSIQ